MQHFCILIAWHSQAPMIKMIVVQRHRSFCAQGMTKKTLSDLSKGTQITVLQKVTHHTVQRAIIKPHTKEYALLKEKNG